MKNNTAFKQGLLLVILLTMVVYSDCKNNDSSDVIESRNTNDLDKTRVESNSPSAFSSHVKNLTDVERIRTFNKRLSAP